MTCQRTAVVLLFLAAFAAAVPVGAQQPPKEHIFLFSASGGISKGAYQGGVDWTLSEFLRRQRTQAFRDRFKLDDRFVLGSATGASAGNINALFAALAWCTEELKQPTSALRTVKGIAAEESLFWKAWVNTGVTELLPNAGGPNPEPAALDRRFFEKVHRQSLDDFRARAIARQGCRVPVGLTLTKLTPIEVALDGGDGNGSAAVQRFATVFQVVSRGTDLDFAPPLKEQGDSKSLGALALLPALYHDDPLGWTPRANAVFNAILASSSFPVAFAPRQVSYLPGGLKPKGVSLGPISAQFADGGVFDNNPLGLAAGLFELGPDGKSELPRMLAYSSPDSYRGVMAEARKADGTFQDKTGLGAAVQLASGAISSARQYELQLFARQMDRDDRLKLRGPQLRLRLSSRAFPIVGETLSSFGAFLGTPFRERDFYLGVYDGLEFLARHVLCEGKQDMELKVCVTEHHIRLVTDDVFAMSPLGQTAMSWFMKDEYGVDSMSQPPATPTALEEHHELLLKRTNDYLPPRNARPADEDCSKGGDPIARNMCPGGLDTLLNKMRNDEDVQAATDALLPECSTAKIARGECVVDKAFDKLIDNPRREVYRLAKKALDNIELAEDRSRNGGLSQWVEMGVSIFRAATYRYRPGPVEFAMSSAREWDEHGKVATIVGYLAPGYLQWTRNLDTADSLSLGWRPVTLVVNDKLFVSTIAELSIPDWSHSKPFAKDAWGIGGSLGSFAVKGTAAVEIGALRLPQAAANRLVPATKWGPEGMGRWVARASVRVLADKVQIVALARPKVFTVGLGLSDLNGVLFWWLR